MKSRKIIAAVIVAVMIAAALSPLHVFAGYAEMPEILRAPMNLRWNAGDFAWYQCVCSNDLGHEKFNYEWFIVYNGTTYPVGVNGSMSDPWWNFVDKNGNSGTIGNTIMLDKIQTGLDGAEIYCVVSNSNGDETPSPRATIMVSSSTIFTPPEITEAPVYLTCFKGDEIELKVSAKPTSGNVTEKKDFITYYWYETTTGRLEDIQLIFDGENDMTGKTYKPPTNEPGMYYYVCGVFDGENEPSMCNYSYTNIIALDVLEKTEALDIEILDNPKKVMYFVGDKVDLTGLRVRILTSDGYMILEGGTGMTVEPEVVTKTGPQFVTVGYDGLKATFKINAVEKSVPVPTITKQPEGGVFTVGEKCTLSVEAKAESGCKLAYQWCEATCDYDYEGGKPVALEVGSTFTPKQTVGQRYYYCSVYAVNDSGSVSDSLTTYIVTVEYKEAPATETEKETETETETVPEETSAPEETSEPAVTADVTVDDTTAAPETDDLTDDIHVVTEYNPGGGGSNIVAVVFLGLIALVMGIALIAVIVVLIVVSKKKKK